MIENRRTCPRRASTEGVVRKLDSKYCTALMQHCSLLLIAWLTVVGCSPVSRNFAPGSEVDANTSELKPDTTEDAAQSGPDGSPAKDATIGTGCEGDACVRDTESGVPPEPSEVLPAPSEVLPGPSGAPTSEALDACSPNPCVHGTCQDLATDFKCECSPGYEGKNCEHDIDDCAGNPCVHGTCTDLVDDFRCTCAAGWGGKTCNAGSCSNVTCPSSAPCRVPSKNAGICYPKACGEAGLCLAENADGSGEARIFAGRNADLRDYDWGNRARYFAYVDDAHGGRACVFPQTSERGAPLVIPLGTKATKSSGFGLSNSWPSDVCK
jgi:EGF-like domain/Human growth factor-like EGF